MARLGELDKKVDAHLVYLLLTPLLLYAAYLSYLYFGRKTISLEGSLIIGLPCIGLTVFFLLRWRRHLEERRNIRIEYEGEVSVGQELNRLMLEGYCVYHDFQADDFRIDHIVVGPKGVFGVETKARSRPTTRGQSIGAIVEYNGRALIYPHGTDINTIKQAERQASWLSNWISSTAGESVIVMAVVALPGWYVKRTSPDGIPVINPKQFHSLLKYVKSKPLDGEVIIQIVLQFEKKCGNTDTAVDQDQIPDQPQTN
ncbi:MAG: nuclease-related domain-containing protein [Desulfobacterales bacterium]